jgi:16S rRNA (cytosine1402-N4)-methyltransferase
MARHSRAVVDRRVPFMEPRDMPLAGVVRVMPSKAEVEANPRSRSSVMRVASRTEALA